MISRISFSSSPLLVNDNSLFLTQNRVPLNSINFGKKSSPINNTILSLGLVGSIFWGGLTLVHSAIHGHYANPWKSWRGDYEKEVPGIKPSVKAPELTQPLKKAE